MLKMRAAVEGVAHPRVSGENVQPETRAGVVAGSSPRERGKRNVGSVVYLVFRLIPA